MVIDMKNRFVFLTVCCLIFLGISACGGINENTEVVLTTGFQKDEVFRIESASAMLNEVMVYLTNTQNQYETVYGDNIWDKEFPEGSLKNRVKETVLAKIAQIKTMTLLAGNYGIALSEEEELIVQAAAKEYYKSLNQTEIETMQVTEELIAQLYREYALADKVYQYIIKDVNPEISDDEARSIIVSPIFLGTYSLDQEGNKIPFEENEKNEVYSTAVTLKKQLDEGEAFSTYMQLYSEDSVRSLTIGKFSADNGQVEQEVVDAAFLLGNGEISDVIETSNGFYILQCVSTFDLEETNRNKIVILEQRKKEAFSQEYDTFVASIKKNLNEKLWEELNFIHDEQVTTASFFDVFDRYFIVE